MGCCQGNSNNMYIASITSSPKGSDISILLLPELMHPPNLLCTRNPRKDGKQSGIACHVILS